MIAFAELAAALGGRNSVDAICPVCSASRKPAHRKLKVLRLWRITDNLITYHCVHCEESGHVFADGKDREVDWKKHEARRKQIDAEANARKAKIVTDLWKRSTSAYGTWAEDYLVGRGLKLPVDREISDRTLRFLPDCPFPDKTKAPALLVAFTPIDVKINSDPFDDPLPLAVHRIRGRGKGNKAMLGPVNNCGMMLSPWWTVWDTLHVCEGIETAISLFHRPTDEAPHEWQNDRRGPVRPIWALGSAGAIERLPVIERVKKLVIWSDKDKSGTGMAAANAAAARWFDAGKEIDIKDLNLEGSDYADLYRGR